ncbi:twin transmembrane helix small protein [Thermaurantiacus sp.]
MDQLLIALIVAAALATAYVLVRGVLTMAAGKDITGVKSNRLMTARVALQATAILLVVLLFLLSGRGAG